MLGWIICPAEEAARRPRTEVRQVCGLPFLTLEAAEPKGWWARRRLERMVSNMGREGVRRVVIQGERAHEAARRAGLCPVERSPLRRRLLPQLLDWVEAAWGLELKGGTVGLWDERTAAETRRAALLLARRARYVALHTGVGQAALEEELRRRCGLGRAPGGGAALQVCLSGQPEGGGPVLYLGEKELARQKLILTAPQLPQGEEMLFSALFEAGKLEIEAITIKSVKFCA